MRKRIVFWMVTCATAAIALATSAGVLVSDRQGDDGGGGIAAPDSAIMASPGVLVSDRQGDDGGGVAAPSPLLRSFPLYDAMYAAGIGGATQSAGSCQAGCDQVWDTCVDYAYQRFDCCLDFCAGPAECSLCRFWLRTDVLICSYQRLCCIIEGCQGQPPGSCGKAPQPAGQSPPDACIAI